MKNALQKNNVANGLVLIECLFCVQFTILVIIVSIRVLLAYVKSNFLQ